MSGRAGGMIGELHWGGDCLGDPGCELEASCELDDTWTMLGWYELAEEPCDVLRPSALGAAAGASARCKADDMAAGGSAGALPNPPAKRRESGVVVGVSHGRLPVWCADQRRH